MWQEMVEAFEIDKNAHVRNTRVPIGARTVRHAFTTLFMRVLMNRRRQHVCMCAGHVIYIACPNRNTTPRSIHSDRKSVV